MGQYAKNENFARKPSRVSVTHGSLLLIQSLRSMKHLTLNSWVIPHQLI
jgi:hypothetical protein